MSSKELERAEQTNYIDMQRLKEAKEELKQKGYNIEKLESVKGGINSSVFKTTTENGDNYALKLYSRKTKSTDRVLIVLPAVTNTSVNGMMTKEMGLSCTHKFYGHSDIHDFPTCQAILDIITSEEKSLCSLPNNDLSAIQ